MAHHDPIGLITPAAGLAQLNQRSREIFRQIVESYLATGEPVGSRTIARILPSSLLACFGPPFLPTLGVAAATAHRQ